MERITAMSSTCSATCGNRSDTSIPDWPYFLNVRLQPSTPDCSNFENCSCTLPKLAGTCWPFSWFSAGFGSNVSRCDGPPCMNRKITLFAVAGKCGFFAACGFVTAAAASAGNPSADIINSRRERLIDIQKLPHIQHQHTQ